MTDREKAIVMAYTGICMLSGDKFHIFHKYIEDIMGRPVYTHELAYDAVEKEIKEKAKDDFLKLCAESELTAHWIKHENDNLGICMRVSYECSNCNVFVGCEHFLRRSFCPNCGAKMVEEE